ncbi:MAG TPA: maleylpyruvate isomerase N-terminal domain-containing protein, partial [Gemmatimonadales bacterium]|nr:maleylpyruvate isomerase N-terminal domain-containing protein [Gemmatimonadales bacterium]
MISGDRALTPVAPVFLVDRFPPLHAELMAVLRGLNERDWTRPTACALWSVKDIAAHLLDTSFRRLSFGRDSQDPTPDTPIRSHAELVAYLNRLNADWVAACRRLSPKILIDLLDFTAGQVHAFFQTLDPYTAA